MSFRFDHQTWAQVRFGDLVRHVTDRVDPENSGLTRYLAGEHIQSKSLHVQNWGTVGDGYLGPAFYKRFMPQHVLYVSRRTYLRKVAVPDFSGICGEKTFVLESNDQNVLLQSFIPVIMWSERFHQYAITQSRGSVNPYLNWTELADYKFFLPPRVLQEKISNLFWATEEDRRAAVGLHDSAGHYLRQIRRHLFGKGPMTTADNVFDITIGRQRSPAREGKGVRRRYLRAANVKDGFLLMEDLNEMDFTDEEMRRLELQPGDVLVTEGCGSPEQLGAAAALSDEQWMPGLSFQNTLLRYRSLPDVTTQRFVYHWARYAFTEELFRNIASGTGILHIGVQRARKMSVHCLSLDEQVRSISILDKAEIAVEASLRRADAASGILHELSTAVSGMC